MKKYLLSLLLVCVGFISFCSADSYLSSVQDVYFSIPATYTNTGGFCFIPEISSSNYKVYTDSSRNELVFNGFTSNYLYCTSEDSLYFYYFTNRSFNIKFFTGINFGLSSGGGSCDPQYTIEECQFEYSLVPSSDLTSCQGDLSSCNSSLSGCQSNLSGCMTNLDNYSTSLNTCSTNLNVCNTSLSSCMSSNCPSNSGNISWSSLFVNGIQHLSAPNIRVNIPEEISWDYLSTSEDFVLDVEGYNQDTEYIESVLEVQNYTPTREDFNNTFMLFKSFSGLIVACLFVILVFYFVKKLFK